VPFLIAFDDTGSTLSASGIFATEFVLPLVKIDRQDAPLAVEYFYEDSLDRDKAVVNWLV
jgi:hypothetical protein